MSSTMAGPMPGSARAGDYYPKLQIAVPFTPVPGPRLLTRDPTHAAALIARRRGAGARSMACRRPTPLSRRGRACRCSRRRVGCSATERHFTGRTPAMRASTISSTRLPHASARRSARNARAAVEGLDDRIVTGGGAHRSALGRVLAFLPGYRRAQMGAALSDPPLLHAAGRADGRQRLLILAYRDGQADRRRAQLVGAIRCTGAIGAAPRTCPFCISSFAIIRRSMPPSRAGWRGSRPARRASTSWRAAMCPLRPGRRTTFPIRASARGRRFSERSAARSSPDRGAGRDGAVQARLGSPLGVSARCGRRRSQARAWRCASAISRAVISSAISARHSWPRSLPPARRG